MVETKQALATIIKGIEATAKSGGFNIIIPDTIKKGEAPIDIKNEGATVAYSSSAAAIKIVVFEDKISLLFAEKPYKSAVESDYRQATLSLFVPDDLTDKDVKYIINEYNDAINETFCRKKNKKSVSKMPTPVSKAAAKNGTVYYDCLTLGSRFVQAYPEFKDAYKENYEKYGEFLAEDFFKNYGTPAILNTIRENNPTKMRKLFKMLNEVYDDGTNEVQSLIAVSILGSMAGDDEMLANCVEYLEDMRLAVIQINRYIKSNKKVKQKLENPPLYKPKKEKKKNPVSNMLGM